MRLHCNIADRIKFNSHIQSILERVKKKNQVAFLIVVDLVGFSLINYTYGYDVGDKVLINIYLKLIKLVEKQDVVRNFYSDDFFILLIGNDLKALYKKLNRIEKLFNEPFPTKNTQIKLDPRICVIEFPNDISDEKDALNQILMFSKFVKSERGTGVFFFKDYSVKMLSNISEIIAVLNKISLENNLLIPAFQNIFNLREKEIYGCEILARIFYNNQIYAAYQFMDIVEHFGFTHKIDEIILRKALEYKLQNNDHRIYFFNISPRFMEKSLKITSKIIKEYRSKGIRSNEICIEITESFEIKEPYRINFLLKEYRNELGVKFALDDFGVGYSNLAVFTTLDIDILKIDRFLITQMPQNPRVVYLLKAFYELSFMANIMLLGEGVENEEQLMMLKKLNYDLAQGYYLQKPEIPSFFKK